jgi:hypothetical protein
MPEPNRLILAPRDQELILLTEDEAGDRLAVTDQTTQLLPGADLPDLNGFIPTATIQFAAV